MRDPFGPRAVVALALLLAGGGCDDQSEGHETPADARAADAGPPDARAADAAPPDAQAADASPADAGQLDSSPADASQPDASPSDAAPAERLRVEIDEGEPGRASLFATVETVAGEDFLVLATDALPGPLAGAQVTVAVEGAARLGPAGTRTGMVLFDDAHGEARGLLFFGLGGLLLAPGEGPVAHFPLDLSAVLPGETVTVSVEPLALTGPDALGMPATDRRTRITVNAGGAR